MPQEHATNGGGTAAAAAKTKKKRETSTAQLEAEAAAAERTLRDAGALAQKFGEVDGVDPTEACCKLSDHGFKLMQLEMAFAIIRAGVHKHGIASDKLCKRYVFMLDQLVKSKVNPKKKPEGPPKMLYLRELFAVMPSVLKEQIFKLAGAEAVKQGERCILMKERSVMVVGLSLQEWRLLLERNSGPKLEMQMISGVEEAVVRGLSQSEGMSDSQLELKMSWNHWALKLCEAEDGSPQLRSRCLLQRTVLLLQAQQHTKALETAGEVLKMFPDNKHAGALLATAQHRSGQKKQAGQSVTDLCLAFQLADDNSIAEELGQPLELAVGLLVDMHRTKDALKLLSCLLGRVIGPRQQPLFFGIARLFAKHGLNKDALVLKLPSLCCKPPDRRTWELLKSMAEYTPVAVEQQLQRYIEETGPGRFTHVPHITEVMCKLPFGAHGSAANKALQLLKQCAAQVTPERPDDLRIIVDDLRAFMSSNIPAAVSEQFPKTIEQLLVEYMQALGPQHAPEAWDMPGELMKRSFNGPPPAVLVEELQHACLRAPAERETFLWAVFRHLMPETGVQLLRAWLLQNNNRDVECMERCCKNLHQSKGEHAAALDLLRWAELNNMPVKGAEPDRWKGLYFRVLRATAEERIATLKRGPLDMLTPVLQTGEMIPLASFKSYHSQHRGADVTISKITQTEAMILRQFMGDSYEQSADDPGLDREVQIRRQRRPATAGEGSWYSRSEMPFIPMSHSEGDDDHSVRMFAQQQQLDLNGTRMLPGELLGPDKAANVPNGEPPLQAPTIEQFVGTGVLGADAVEMQGENGNVPPFRVGAAPSGLLKSLHQPLLPGQSPDLNDDGAAHKGSINTTFVDKDFVAGTQMFTQEQLLHARAILDQLQLKEHVPQRSNDDEAWSSFAHELFTSVGWRQLGFHYVKELGYQVEQNERQLTKQLLFTDMQRLQNMLRQNSAPGHHNHSDLRDLRSLEWLFELVQDNLGAVNEPDIQNMEPERAVDLLAFELGQRHVWEQRFLSGCANLSFSAASAHARAPFKLAFLHAANQHCSPRGGHAANSVADAKSGEHAGSPASTENWTMQLIHQNLHTDTCHRLLVTDPEGALAMATQLLDDARGTVDSDQMELLQLMCGDACFALKQHARSISHFQRFSPSGVRSMHALPLDALLEYICAMLQEGYPPSQVTQVAEDSCFFDGALAEGWIMLVKVLAEMVDAENAIEQAAEEENRHMVNKLLMLLGSNVTNKRERDARMQRCLQEGADANSERDTNSGSRRPNNGRRQRTDDDSATVDHEQLLAFWQQLPLEERPGLCRVPVEEFEKSVLQLATALSNGEREREAARDGVGRPVSSAEAESSAGVADTLLMQLRAAFTDKTAESLNGSQSTGFQLSDALCNIQSLAESTSDGLCSRLTACGLFQLQGEVITLGSQAQAAALTDASGNGDAANGRSAEQEPLIPSAEVSTELATLDEPESSSDASPDVLERLLAVEADFEFDVTSKDRKMSMDLGLQLTFHEVLLLVRTTSLLHQQVGGQLPHARQALWELCRRLLRKEPLRALMTAQRAVLAALAKLMLRGVRAACGEEQQKLKKEEAARAERELLEELEAEDVKKDGSEGMKKKPKKKKKPTKVETAKDEPMEGAVVGGEAAAAPSLAPVHETSPSAGAESERVNKGAAKGAEMLSNGPTLTTQGSTSHTDAHQLHVIESLAAAAEEEDRAARDAREAAEALAVVEAFEAEEARLALAAVAGQAPMPEEWETATRGRRVRRDKPSEAVSQPPAAAAPASSEAAETADANTARASRRRGGGGAGEGGSGAGEEEEERTPSAESGKSRRRKSKPKQAAAADASDAPSGDVEGATEEGTASLGTPEAPRLPGASLLQMPLLSLGESPSAQLQRLLQPPAAGDAGGFGSGFELRQAEQTSHAATVLPLMPDGAMSANGGGLLYTEPENSWVAGSGEGGLHTPVGDLPTGGKRQGSSKRGKARELDPAAAATVGDVAGSSASSSSSTSSSAGGNAYSSAAGATNGANGPGRRGPKRGRHPATASTSSGAGVEDEASSLVSVAAPGLENKTGQHSCFVNVVVQTLWNMCAFRDAFLTEKPQVNATEEDRSIFLAMTEVCAMMEDHSAADAAPGKQPKQATASALKEALYRLDSSFELGEMHDATEAHEALLEALHRATKERAASRGGAGAVYLNGSDGAAGATCGGGQAPVDGDLSGESFIKRIFSMQMLMEYAKPTDPKEEASKPLLFNQWTQYVNACELREVVRAEEARPEAASAAPVASPLVRMLRKAAGTEELAEGHAAAPGSGKLRMLAPPRVFTLALASTTAHATKAEISESLDGIEERLNLRDVYEGINEDVHCQLQALTAFYESHYVCFCFSQVAGQWIHYDDDTRRVVGADFTAVKQKCVAGRLHPQLLFFERVD